MTGMTMPHEMRFAGLHERLTELIRLYTEYLPKATVYNGGQQRISIMIKMFRAIYDAVLKRDFLLFEQLAVELEATEKDGGAYYLGAALQVLHDQELANNVLDYLNVTGQQLQAHPEVPAHFGGYN